MTTTKRNLKTRAQPAANPAACAGAVDPFDWPAGWVFAFLLAAVLVAYLPAMTGAMLWDDSGHITRADLRSLAGLGRIWFEIGATQQYYPVLHSAFWLEHLVWGDATLGYHLLNVLLHASAAFLFGLVLRRLSVPGAWLAALLFALHPVCVESVAWISEQKNTLSAVFYLGAALVWLSFDSERRQKLYVWASALFLLAILTKTVAATLPAALLVVQWWRRGHLKWRRDVVPLLPWFGAALVMGVVTAHFEHELIGARGEDFHLTLAQRALLAGRVGWFYLGKLLWPAPLVFIYPRWTVDSGALWQWLFPVASVTALVALMSWSRRRRGPLAVALLFGGTLFPVLGFFNVFPFVFSYVADHFQYLASLAVFAGVAAWSSDRLASQSSGRRFGIAAVVLLALGTLTWRQSGDYRDNATLYAATLRKNPAAWLAHHNLAMELAASGKVVEAVAHAEAVLTLKSDYAPGENNLGHDLTLLDRAPEAIPHLARAIQLQPNYAVAHRNLGLALAMCDRTAEALTHFERAAQLDPTDAEAELNWGIALLLTRDFASAQPHFERALRLNPSSVDAHNNYGRALATVRRYDDAIAQFQQALQLAPDFADPHLNLAQALRQLGRTAEAKSHAEAAAKLSTRKP
jgi:tetratricopeptide (TPR) repeat protein